MGLRTQVLQVLKVLGDVVVHADVIKFSLPQAIRFSAYPGEQQTPGGAKQLSVITSEWTCMCRRTC